MKWQYIVIPLALVAGLALSEGEPDRRDMMRRITDFGYSFLEARCEKVSRSEIHELKIAFANFTMMRCTDDPDPQSLAEYLKLLCKERPYGNYDCLKVFFDKVEPCLKPEEHFVTEFLLNGYNSTLEHICGNEEAFLNRVDAIQTFGQNHPQMQDCDREIVDICCNKVERLNFVDDQEVVLTSSWFCSNLKTLGDCYVGHLKEKCEASDVADFLNNGLQHLLEWCVKHEPNED